MNTSNPYGGAATIAPRGPVWITGAGGLIGACLIRMARHCGAPQNLLGLTRPVVDLTDHRRVADLCRKERPSLILHCAGMTRSPACQANPDLARRVNVDATRCLAESAPGARFVLLSTDLVFDGRKGQYAESDAVGPLSVYGETKVAAESMLASHPNAVIVRTSLNYGSSPTGDRSFHEDMLAAARRGETLRLFEDEFRSPIPVEATARAVWELALGTHHGTFHVGGAQRLSRWELGQLLARRFPELEGRLQRTSLVEYRGAPRPPDVSLDSSRAQTLLSFRLPGFQDWLLGKGEEGPA